MMVHLTWGNEENLKILLEVLDNNPKTREDSSSILVKMAKKLEAAARGELVISDEEITVDIDAQIDNLNTSFG